MLHLLRLRKPRWTTLVLCLLVASAQSPLYAQSTDHQPSAIVRVADEIDLDTVGNATSRSEIVFAADDYQKLKKLMSPRYTVQENGQQVMKLKAPKVENVIRYLGMTSTAYEIQDLKGEFDDEAATILLTFRILGRVNYRQGHWSFGLTQDPDAKIDVHKVEIKGESAALELRNRQNNVQMITRLNINLPSGATKIEFRPRSFELVYDAPPAMPTAQNPAQRPELRFETKPQLMSAIYKLYGNPKWFELWVARSVFRNDTAETLSDYRARFRIDEYSSWTPWKRTDRVFPGQTVVDAFYPIIDSKIAQLKGATPAQVELEYEYTRPDGQKVTESESGRTKLLGMNEALWSSLELDENSTWFDIFRNGPMLLTSFTSATDPVMLDVVGLVSKAAGGSAHSISDEAALRYMGTLYNLLRQNIAYETTPGGFQDGLLHQHLKYGRDVLRTRSGTCVNLSILYASACEAVGLKAFIVLGPGHAFAAAKLPSGLPVFVETTGCGGGTKESSMTFVQARESAFKTYQKWYANGEMIETDIQSIRQSGVPSPELPDLGPNPLKEWGIQQPDAVSMDQVYLPKLLVNVKLALDAVQLPYGPVSGKSAVQINFSTKAGNEWRTVLQTVEDAEVMVIMSVVPGKVVESQRQTVASFLAEHNTNFYHGCFELSKDGAISFRTSTDVRGGLLAPKMVQNEVDIHFKTMEKNLPELRKLVALPATTGSQQQAANNQPAPQGSVNRVLVGSWKTSFRDGYGNLIAHGAILAADGTFVTVTTAGNGVSVQMKGRWYFKDNVLTSVYDNQQTVRGSIKIINDNRIVFHDPTLNTDLTYDRIIEKK